MENMGEKLRHSLERNRLNEQFQEVMEQILANPEVRTFINENRKQLTDEEIRKSYAKLYEYVQEKERFDRTGSSKIAPGYEPQLILNHHFIDVSYIPTAELIEREREKTIRDRVNAVAIPKDIRNANFGNFEITEERRHAFAQALNFIEDYQDNPRKFHKGLYLQGSFGVGKTFLLGAIANDLAIKGFETTIMHFPTFAVEMKQSIGKGGQDLNQKIDSIKKSPILMLDDIGADSMSSWIRDDVLGVILQYRMQEQLPTFFSSNFNMEQLENEHLRVTQRGEDEPLKAKRIMERIRYLAREIQMVGKNRRNA